MKWLLIISIFVVGNITIAQNPDGFDGMCGENISGSVPTATPEQLIFEYSRNQNLVILDTRELGEYNISHIKGARCVGYESFDIKSVADIKKNLKVYVYCSIGYRSEKIGEKLLANGFTSVYNLYGGIFNWLNNDYPLIDNRGKPTKRVHGYDKDWSQWVNKKKAKVVLK